MPPHTLKDTLRLKYPEILLLHITSPLLLSFIRRESTSILKNFAGGSAIAKAECQHMLRITLAMAKWLCYPERVMIVNVL
ncbi:hypothetical protein KSX_77180 [Ktedonospora formicarum]|uniref:Uncharacterized protein n=1 Tax=Ktedonospora formicarum TaxID=2778364 RepID=A0A8J3MVP6_9CHLR|nr:hypothetical protein KSX_77180 [Ktedonospora formicarum]